MRAWLAVWIGRAVLWLLRASGRRASTLPGAVALAVAPGLLAALRRRVRVRVVLVTGTNGKTTTARMIGEVLQANGHRVVANREGANLDSGLATALLAAPAAATMAVLEVDEATLPRVVTDLAPDLVVVTNFFRDQLDRFGELATTVRKVAQALAGAPVGTRLILNADDPLVASLAPPGGPAPTFFGLESPPTSTGGASDAPACPRCGGPLGYQAVHYGHVGVYRCQACGFGRPNLDVAALHVQTEGLQGTVLSLRLYEASAVLRLPVPGLYNVYNALAALAVVTALGIRLDAALPVLAAFKQPFGRMERTRFKGHDVVLALVKNPVGFDQVLTTFLDETGDEKVFCFVINDRAADGHDVSWLWDVQIEWLAAHARRVRAFVTGGLRGWDMAVRLKYAGIALDQLIPAGSAADALARAATAATEGSVIYILPTYTALWEVREALAREGAALESAAGRR